MVLLIGGVVAGAAVGNLIAPDTTEGDPIRIGLSNDTADSATRLVGDGAAPTIKVTQQGDGPAIVVGSAKGAGGQFQTGAADRNGLYVRNSAPETKTGSAITAAGGNNVGVHATSSASIGLLADSESLAILAAGKEVVTGDLAIGGSCLDCRQAVIAINSSNVALQQGQVVTVAGVTKDSDGGLVLQVALAQAGDPVIGVVDTAMERRTQRVPGSRALVHEVPSGGVMQPGGLVRVLTAGIVEFVRVDFAGGEIDVGDDLIAGDTPGTLTKAIEPRAGRAVGYALGKGGNGFVAVLVWPH